MNEKSANHIDSGFVKPAKNMMRHIGKAIADFDMIQEGDRILLGVSGGKDSLSLLHILRHLQRYSPVKFHLGVITVDPMVDGFDPSPLCDYYDALNIPYFYIKDEIMERAKETMKGDSFCAYCSRMKRGIMYRVCRENNYNVVALAQHLDDLAESLLMSLFHGGQLRTMKAHYLNDAGDIRIIRPLVYCRERQTTDFSAKNQFPVVPDSCPACFSAPTERDRMKQFLLSEETTNPHLFSSMKKAMRDLMV
jgi:tRNA(Ile)-lysidine synthase TilS/MesJ